MNPNLIKAVTSGVLFVFIFISGYVLNHAGKPYNTAIFTIHKLIALALVVFMGISIFQLQRVNPLTPLETGLLVLAIVFVVALFASGGVMSAVKDCPQFVFTLHQVTPYLAVLSTAVLFYSMLRGL